LVKNSGEVGDDAPVSKVGIRVVVLHQGFGDVCCQNIPRTLSVRSFLVVVVGDGRQRRTGAVENLFDGQGAAPLYPTIRARGWRSGV
jgi:hypothetical protein